MIWIFITTLLTGICAGLRIDLKLKKNNDHIDSKTIDEESLRTALEYSLLPDSANFQIKNPDNHIVQYIVQVPYSSWDGVQKPIASWDYEPESLFPWDDDIEPSFPWNVIKRHSSWDKVLRQNSLRQKERGAKYPLVNTKRPIPRDDPQDLKTWDDIQGATIPLDSEQVPESSLDDVQEPFAPWGTKQGLNTPWDSVKGSTSSWDNGDLKYSSDTLDSSSYSWDNNEPPNSPWKAKRPTSSKDKYQELFISKRPTSSLGHVKSPTESLYRPQVGPKGSSNRPTDVSIKPSYRPMSVPIGPPVFPIDGPIRPLLPIPVLTGIWKSATPTEPVWSKGPSTAIWNAQFIKYMKSYLLQWDHTETLLRDYLGRAQDSALHGMRDENTRAVGIMLAVTKLALSLAHDCSPYKYVQEYRKIVSTELAKAYHDPDAAINLLTSLLDAIQRKTQQLRAFVMSDDDECAKCGCQPPAPDADQMEEGRLLILALSSVEETLDSSYSLKQAIENDEVLDYLLKNQQAPSEMYALTVELASVLQLFQGDLCRLEHRVKWLTDDRQSNSNNYDDVSLEDDVVL